MKKLLLGDYVHVDYDGKNIILTTEERDLALPTNCIYLSPDIMRKLINFHNNMSDTEIMPRFAGVYRTNKGE